MAAAIQNSNCFTLGPTQCHFGKRGIILRTISSRELQSYLDNTHHLESCNYSRKNFHYSLAPSPIIMKSTSLRCLRLHAHLHSYEHLFHTASELFHNDRNLFPRQKGACHKPKTLKVTGTNINIQVPVSASRLGLHNLEKSEVNRGS